MCTFLGADVVAGGLALVELDGALDPPEEGAALAANALPAGTVAQAIPAIRASKVVVFLQSIRIVFGAYGVS